MPNQEKAPFFLLYAQYQQTPLLGHLTTKDTVRKWQKCLKLASPLFICHYDPQCEPPFLFEMHRTY